MIQKLSSESEQFLQRTEIHGHWASSYLNPDMDRFYDLAFDDILKRLRLRSSDRLLDAGCGYCYHTIRLARSGAHITGIDFSDAALDAARQTLTETGMEDLIALQKADITGLPFETASFDAIVCWGVLMHVPEMERALSELARVLKSGGTLVLCENNMYSLDVVLRENAINGVKRMLGRKVPQVLRTPRGIEVWNQREGGGLMVRKARIRFLADKLADQGLTQIARTAGQFSEAYTNLPGRQFKRIVYALNTFYFRYVRIPHLAMGNIIYFRKK